MSDLFVLWNSRLDQLRTNVDFSGRRMTCRRTNILPRYTTGICGNVAPSCLIDTPTSRVPWYCLLRTPIYRYASVWYQFSAVITLVCNWQHDQRSCSLLFMFWNTTRIIRCQGDRWLLNSWTPIRINKQFGVHHGFRHPSPRCIPRQQRRLDISSWFRQFLRVWIYCRSLASR